MPDDSRSRSMLDSLPCSQIIGIEECSQPDVDEDLSIIIQARTIETGNAPCSLNRRCPSLLTLQK